MYFINNTVAFYRTFQKILKNAETRKHKICSLANFIEEKKTMHIYVGKKGSLAVRPMETVEIP